MARSAEQAIITSAFVTLGSTYAGSVVPEGFGGKGEPPNVRRIIGGMAAFTMLLLMAQFAENLAKGFAVAIAVIAFLTSAAPILEKFIYAK